MFLSQLPTINSYYLISILPIYNIIYPEAKRRIYHARHGKCHRYILQVPKKILYVWVWGLVESPSGVVDVNGLESQFRPADLPNTDCQLRSVASPIQES